jgi:hypothetical protein
MSGGNNQSLMEAGSRPVAEVKAFGVSPPPYDAPLLFRQKWPKPLTPLLALWEGRDANRKSGPTRRAQTGSAKCEERPFLWPAGRRLVLRRRSIQRCSRKRETRSIDGGKNVGVGCTARACHQDRDASGNKRKMDPR